MWDAEKSDLKKIMWISWIRKNALYAAALAVLVLFAACGGGAEDSPSSSSNNGGTTQAPSDLSGIARTPDASWHDSYLTGAHANYQCGDCHTTSAAYTNGRSVSEQICYQCHAGDYASTSILPHSAYNTGTRCNACHYSDSFTSHTRVDHSEYHGALTTSCASCHSGAYPSSHAGDGRTSGCENCHQYSGGSWALSGGSGSHNYTSGCSGCHSGRAPANHYGTTCENCHSYPSWSQTAAFSHTGITSGCSSCHSRHYSGYECEWCHTSGISWRWSHNNTDRRACAACHGDGYDDDDGDDHDDGDDDGDDDDGDDDDGDDDDGDDHDDGDDD